MDVPYEAARAPQTSLALAEAIQLLHPEEARARREEEGEMKSLVVNHRSVDEGLPSFPLFVLEPLMPGQMMSLHVFEPRYIRLTERALSERRLERSFGMIASAPRPSGLATHGVQATIVEHQRVPGGRYLLTVKARRRFRILRTWDVDGYRNASIVWAGDQRPPPRPMAAAARSHSARPSGESDAGGGGEASAAGGDPPRRPLEADMSVDVQLLQASILADELREAIRKWLSIVDRGGFENRRNEILDGLMDYGPPRVVVWQDNTWADLETLGLWAAAVINPLPPLGLAPEIRLPALELTDTTARLTLILEATERSVAMLSRPNRGLLPDSYRVLVILAILAGLLVAHTSVLDGVTSWVRELADGSAPPIAAREAQYLAHKSGLLSWF